MFHWSSIFLMAFSAIAFLPISSAQPDICSSSYACNSVTIARLCQKEEWCKKQGAACDTILILQDASEFYFLDIMLDLRQLCHYQFLAYKKPGTDTVTLAEFASG